MSAGVPLPPDDQRAIARPADWIVLFVAALVLRLINLDADLWVDEIDSLVTSFRPPLSEILGEFPRDNRHPFYSALAHLCIALFGEHNWVIRLPSVIFGAATVPLLYVLGTKLLSRREALLSAAFLAVSYHHVWFSQNARGYAMLGFFAVLGAWLLIRLMEDGRPSWAAWYAVAMAVGTWTHLTMVFVAVGHAAACVIGFLVSRQRGRTVAWKPVALAFVLSAVFTLLLYAPVLGDVAHYFRNKPSGLRGISTNRWAVVEAVRVLLEGLGGAGAAAALIALVLGGLLFGAGLLSFWRRRPLVLGMFVAPAFVTIAGAAVARGTMYPRFFFAIAPYFVLVAVRGAFALAELAAARRGPAARGKAEALPTLAVVLLIVLSFASLVRIEYRYPKQPFEQVHAWVQAERTLGDRVATVDITTPVYHGYLATDWDSVETAADLAALRRGNRVWLVYTFPQYLVRGAPEIAEVTERECQAATAFKATVGGGDVYVCQLGPMP